MFLFPYHSKKDHRWYKERSLSYQTPLFLPLSKCFFVSLYLCFSVSLCLSLFASLFLSLSLSMSPSICLCLPTCVCVCVYVSDCVCMSLYLSLSIFLSPYQQMGNADLTFQDIVMSLKVLRLRFVMLFLEVEVWLKWPSFMAMNCMMDITTNDHGPTNAPCFPKFWIFVIVVYWIQERSFHNRKLGVLVVLKKKNEL